jgi:hypothetical protein
MPEPAILTQTGTRLRLGQWLTVGLMVVGDAGYYLCRSNLLATMPSMRRYDDMAKVHGRVVPGLEHYRSRRLRMVKVGVRDETRLR